MRPAGTKWLVVFLGLSLGVVAGAALEIGGARAEGNQGRGVELLSRATKSYQAGAYTDAAEQIDSAFKAGLTGDMAARAILLRAEINERGGALAKALQDYSNALWMDALPAADRKRATEGKERVMAAMGIASPAAGASTQAAAPASSAQPGNSSGGVFGFITGVFGGSERTTAPPLAAEPQQSAQPSQPVSASPAPQKATAQKAPDKAAAKPAKAAARAQPAAPVGRTAEQPASALSVASAPGGILIVFGSASSEASGRSTAKTIKAQLSDILINRELDVTARPAGGFQIQAGPYKSKSSAAALCSAIKQRGIQCQVTP